MKFNVTLRPSGHSFEVDENTPILSAGLAAGHYLRHSCRQGHCSSCKAQVLAGEYDTGDAGEPYLTLDDKNQGRALLCRATAQSDLVIEVEEVGGLEGLRTTTVPCRVISVEKAASDVAVLRVRLPMNENMLFVAGQYVEFILADGSRRPYSIALPPTPEGVRELEFHLKHMPGGKFTDHVFTSMKARDLLKFEGPLGTFILRDSSKPVILLATGTGFSPVKSILLQAFASRLNEVRDIHLFWGARSAEDLYMVETAQRWASNHSGFSFTPVVSGSGTLPAGGYRGRVQDAVLSQIVDLSNYQVYACGSPEMIASARLAFHARGLPASEFHADEFLPAVDNGMPQII